MKFSYTAIWDDTKALVRANGSLVAALTGVFIFLPTLLLTYLVPRPETTQADQVGPLIVQYLTTNWHWLLLENLVNMLGTLAILLLVLRARGTSVGEAISAALLLLPGYFLAAVLTNIAVGFGFMLFIIPGLYLFARFLPLAPAVAAEGERNPVTAISRAWALSKGHGWGIAGFILVVALAGALLMTVVNLVLGLIIRLAAPEDLGRLLEAIVASAAAAAFSALLILVYAAIYRRLAAQASGGAGATSGI